MVHNNRQKYELTKYLMDCGKFIITTVSIGRMLTDKDVSWWIFFGGLLSGIVVTGIGYFILGDIHDMDEKKTKSKR